MTVEDDGDFARPLHWYHLFILAPVYLVFGAAEMTRKARCKMLGHKIRSGPCYTDDYCLRCYRHLN